MLVFAKKRYGQAKARPETPGPVFNEDIKLRLLGLEISKINKSGSEAFAEFAPT